MERPSPFPGDHTQLHGLHTRSPLSAFSAVANAEPPHLLLEDAEPGEDDVHGDEDGARGVQPPRRGDVRRHPRRHHRRQVAQCVVAVVLRQRKRRAAHLAQSVADEEEHQLAYDGAGQDALRARDVGKTTRRVSDRMSGKWTIRSNGQLDRYGEGARLPNTHVYWGMTPTFPTGGKPGNLNILYQFAKHGRGSPMGRMTQDEAPTIVKGEISNVGWPVPFFTPSHRPATDTCTTCAGTRRHAPRRIKIDRERERVH